MDAVLILIILKFLGLVHLSWLGAIGYGLLIDFIIFVILIALGVYWETKNEAKR